MWVIPPGTADSSWPALEGGVLALDPFWTVFRVPDFVHIFGLGGQPNGLPDPPPPNKEHQCADKA